MLCGIGFDGKVAHDFAKANQRGLATYVKKIFSNFFYSEALFVQNKTKQQNVYNGGLFYKYCKQQPVW